MRKKDCLLFWRHILDDNGKLKHIFWCDGTSQNDYLVFGDVLGFDATYGRNKYKCPVVVFSGVNHHLNTIIFGCAILSDEKEPTYVWLLRQFLEAMKGKSPNAVITDGDGSMRSAIRTVFPNAHHRLCGWHLIRNATSNVGNAKFTKEFKKCMMGDYEEEEFKEKWGMAIEEYVLEDNTWVVEMYEKRHMWANAHMRGKFFAGLRTTSRCEALHSQIGKYIQSGYNLTEFMEHFDRYLEYMRFRELQSDCDSCYGEPVLKTQLEALERHACLIYTKEVFKVFREVLVMASTVKAVGYKRTTSSYIFFVTKYCNSRKVFHVSYYLAEKELRCSCLRMESFGVPCVHIVSVMVFLDMTELPKCLILDRWTKKAKEVVNCQQQARGVMLDACYASMYTALLDDCRDLCKLATRSFEDYATVKEKVYYERLELRSKPATTVNDLSLNTCRENVELRDPERVRHKGCGSRQSSGVGRVKRIQRCTKCRNEGHNSRKCPFGAEDLDDSDLNYTSAGGDDDVNNSTVYTDLQSEN